jgi:hypothetical protein
MASAILTHESEQTGRYLFVLLDAADESGMLSSATLKTRWLAAREEIALKSDYETHVSLFSAMLADLESSGALAGTWIGYHWISVKGRLSAAR